MIFPIWFFTHPKKLPAEMWSQESSQPRVCKGICRVELQTLSLLVTMHAEAAGQPTDQIEGQQEGERAFKAALGSNNMWSSKA